MESSNPASEINTYEIDRAHYIYGVKMWASVYLRFYGDLPRFKVLVPFVNGFAYPRGIQINTCNCMCPSEQLSILIDKFNELGWREINTIL